jgi:hypothetical protein
VNDLFEVGEVPGGERGEEIIGPAHGYASLGEWCLWEVAHVVRKQRDWGSGNGGCGVHVIVGIVARHFGDEKFVFGSWNVLTGEGRADLLANMRGGCG